ncbi:hypothetical protein [Nitratireductor indicus]|uniref:Lipoprotein n=1 Tax=Nitratireductor indicus C115 TaxID=1231190 RepID=K2P0Z8_9HYPH|nr:hypothetical protein [Nitratireductor indicus]EKF41026.1 hypothetical protein NA8A_17695 [Nitratireductor indicus C115]MDS1135046.1 hypothetical protein [Nitratireductor indicus]SFQ73881.1 hypothetical protein SAMN05216176_11256 [Nitratireductor indicus]
MKLTRRGAFFPAAAICAALAALSGCTTTNLADIAPTSATATPVPQPRPQETAANPVAQPSGGGPRETGEYPNLNVAPTRAANPISDAEKSSIVRDLTATRNSVNANAPSVDTAAETRRLRELARTHAQRQLEEIEKSE